jgi:hypothetical protein
LHEQKEEDRINWQVLAKEAFKGKYSAKDLVFEFITMPISESLKLDCEADLPAELVEEHLNTRKRTLDAAHAYMDEYRS